ncbi:hypothetical protein ABIB80_007493 [Bradyrhizobium sp. i1.15.2]|uniref:SGNH/GDSL hydrolase family protein n=1 Tax=Bradyrhizobium sp. i1.15.2 TaxID=3156362 RepID=UPI0033948C9A
MQRAMPWILSVVLLIAFGASFSELQRVRKRLGEVPRHTFHDHQDVRRAVIRAHLADAYRPIVIVGDSITEMASFPNNLDGNPVINAGIGGATILDYTALAPTIFEGSKPSLIVVTIGANDTANPNRQQNMKDLLLALKPFSPIIVMDPPKGETVDGIHPTRRVSRLWVQSVVDEILRSSGKT